MEPYQHIITNIKKYFPLTWKDKFLHGGCFWLAKYIHQQVPDSVIMINRQTMHAAIKIQNQILDITGSIPKENFHPATKKELKYMQKHFIPQFNTEQLANFLNNI